METIIKLNNQAAGRDKLARSVTFIPNVRGRLKSNWCNTHLHCFSPHRILQYGSRALWYIMQQHKMNHQTIEKLRALEYTFSSFRKCKLFFLIIESCYNYYFSYCMKHVSFFSAEAWQVRGCSLQCPLINPLP